MSPASRGARQLRAVLAEARPWLTARLPGLGLFLLLDVVAAGLGYAWLATRLVPGLLEDLHHRIHPGFLEGVASDFQGTAWFYWWYGQARARGVELLTPDVVCAPTGQGLGQNFPQQLDALLAQPFLDNLSFPGGFNLFMVATLVASALAGHIGLRALTRSRLAAFAGGALYGFSAFGVAQLVAGRPTISLVASIPLFAACWLRVTEARGRVRWAWCGLAGVIGAMAVQHYVVYAGLLVLLALLIAGARIAVPAPGVSRWRPLMALVLVGFIGLGCSAPYLQELLQRRPITHEPSDRLTQGGAYDPRTWMGVGSELVHALRGGPGGTRRLAPSLSEPAIRLAQEQALTVGWLWGGTDGQRPPPANSPPILLLAALALLPFGRRRALAWLGATAVFYSLTLGPAACHAIATGPRWVTLAGRTLPMPTYLALWKLPWIAQVWHPERGSPIVVFCLLACLVVGLEGAGALLTRLTGLAPERAWRARLPIMLLAVPIGWLGLRQVEAAGGLDMHTVPWEPHPYLQRIAAEDGAFAIIDLPLGLGHGLGVSQIVHGHPRANSHHDDLAALGLGQPPPDDCYRLPLLRGLWDLQIEARGQQPRPARPTPDAIPGTTDPAAIEEAVAAGFRYAVLFRAGYHKLETHHDERVQRRNTADLRRVLGPPMYRDDDLLVWSLEAAPGVEPGDAP